MTAITRTIVVSTTFGLLFSVLVSQGAGEVKFYEHGNRKGKSFTLKRGKSDKSLKKRRIYGVRNWNDRISSLSVSNCTRVRLYQHTDYKGKSVVYETKYYDKSVNVNLPKSWNDKASSIRTATASGCKYSKPYALKPTPRYLSISVKPRGGSTYSATGGKFSATVKNTSSYFYLMKVPSAYPKQYRLLGKGERHTFSGKAGRFPYPASGITHTFHVESRFNLGVYYLQAAYSILFGSEPPTKTLDGVLGLVAEYSGVDLSAMYQKDPKWFATKFVELVAENAAFRKRLLKAAGKEASETWLKNRAKQVLSVTALIERAKALRYFAGSLRMPDREFIQVSLHK